jgi:hypothetical protein
MANAQSPSTPLQEFNKEFRLQYGTARTNFWLSTTTDGSSVIIANGSSLTLIHQGNEQKIAKAIPQVYHDLKSISHIPITIYMHFINHRSAGTDGTSELHGYLELLNALEVPSSIINPSEREAGVRIITACRTLLQTETDNRGTVDTNHLTSVCRTLQDDLFTLTNGAALAQLEEMHRIIQG